MIEPKDIELIQTCGAYPERYDAYYKDKYVGYLRLRHGFFTVDYMDKNIYEAYPKGDGIFEPDERDKYLYESRSVIAKHINDQQTKELEKEHE